MNNPFRVGGLNFWARDVTVTLDGRNLGCKRTWILKTPPWKRRNIFQPPIFCVQNLSFVTPPKDGNNPGQPKSPSYATRYWENRTSQDVSHLVGR